MVRRDVAIIGAGLAGLVASLRLARAGRRVVCLDAAPVAGGKVRTEREAGYLLEVGPQAFLDEPAGPVRTLAADLGIADEIVAARPDARKRYVLARGRMRLVPREVPQILGPEGLIRALREPFVPRRVPGRGGAEESVASFARRRFGRAAATALFDPLVSGVYAGDPERLSVEAAFPRLSALERDFGSVILGVLQGGFKPRPLATFRRGMGALTEALAAALGADLRLGGGPSSIRRSLEGWRIETGEGPIDAAAAVIAAPAFVAARLLGGEDPRLAELLLEIPYASAAVILLGYDAAVFPGGPPPGFGFLAPACERLLTLGCLFPSTAFEGAAPPGKVLLRAIVGGRRRPDALGLDDEELVARVRREVEPRIGARGAPERVRIFRHPRGIPQYEIGHGRRVAAIEARARALPRLWLTGNAYGGVAVGEVVADADRTARAVLEGG